jgi:hypothetical protein
MYSCPEDSFQKLVLGDLALAGASLPERIDQSQDLVKAAVPLNGIRCGRMQWLHSISEFFPRGIWPHRDVFFPE